MKLLVAATILMLALVGCTEKEANKSSDPEPSVRTEASIRTYTGSIKVERSWRFDNQQNQSTGQYQFLLPTNELLVVMFCAPTPDFKEGEVLTTLKFDTDGGNECYPFISASR